MTDSIFNDRPFLEFLSTQGEDLIQQLYESQHCVIAIMRMLPFDVQQCLIQLMFIKRIGFRGTKRCGNNL